MLSITTHNAQRHDALGVTMLEPLHAHMAPHVEEVCARASARARVCACACCAQAAAAGMRLRCWHAATVALPSRPTMYGSPVSLSCSRHSTSAARSVAWHSSCTQQAHAWAHGVVREQTICHAMQTCLQAGAQKARTHACVCVWFGGGSSWARAQGGLGEVRGGAAGRRGAAHLDEVQLVLRGADDALLHMQVGCAHRVHGHGGNVVVVRAHLRPARRGWGEGMGVEKEVGAPCECACRMHTHDNTWKGKHAAAARARTQPETCTAAAAAVTRAPLGLCQGQTTRTHRQGALFPPKAHATQA